ncbi:MAG TPA: VanZ family protein [Candidatus Krumholzibacteria bacterium]|nr:VanZ family protein [Candidatus Krumholzibacteria bacterium]
MRAPFRIRGSWLFLSALYVGLIFFVSSRPYLRPPGPEFALKDKLAHCTEYGVLGWLLSRALRPARTIPPALEVLWFVALGAGIAGLDELFQGTVAGRVMDIKDWMADVTGLMLGASLSLWHARRKRASA